jgi:homoserine kinase type II
MAVYTEVSADEADALLQQLKLGALKTLQACGGGIENTNYFVTATSNGECRDYVLTLFERLTFKQLPFYLRLMKHLAQRGIPVPDPSANAQGELAPTPAHCFLVGSTLARMHLAGRDFPLTQPNLRGLAWWNQTAPVVQPYLNASQAALLQGELAYQNHIAASSAYSDLPCGPIHADLFRDNVMFEGRSGEPQLSGFFDFYFAGVDSWLFDLAVCLNDWCVNLATSTHDPERFQSFVRAYNAVRPLQAAERTLLPAMLRGAALRFWISRLWDYHLPRVASLLKAHDPGHFEQVLRERVMNPVHLNAIASCA